MPTFEVTDDDGEYERIIEAYDAGEAAEEWAKWAKKVFADKDYPKALDAICTDSGGAVTRWHLEVQLVPVFTAYPSQESA